MKNMSADGNDSGPIWQGPINAGRNQFIEQVQLPDQGEPPPLVPQQQEEALHLGISPQTNNQEDVPLDTSSAPSDLVKQLWQYFTLILAPLLFGALTCLFVLPLVATGR